MQLHKAIAHSLLEELQPPPGHHLELFGPSITGHTNWGIRIHEPHNIGLYEVTLAPNHIYTYTKNHPIINTHDYADPQLLNHLQHTLNQIK